MKPRGRRVAIGAVLIGVAVIVAAAVALKRPALEQWYLWELRSIDEAERELAARRLGEMKSTRAIPPLIEILRWIGIEHRGTVRSVAFSPDGRVLATASSSGAVRLWDATNGKIVRVLGATSSHYSAKALAKIGKLAVPALVRLLKAKDVEIRLAAAVTLGQMGSAVAEAAPALREALEDENESVREAAAQALDLKDPTERVIPIRYRLFDADRGQSSSG